MGAPQQTVRTPVLDIGYHRHGPDGGWPVVLLHGFPYDVRCYEEVADRLAAAGADVVVPYLRGYGPTRFREASTLRSGQQAALAHDLLDLVEVLGLDRPVVAGFDWGGRAACLTALLWPGAVAGLVTVSGYNVQDIAAAATPDEPRAESRLWYQWYLHNERGRAGLAAHRADFARQLWGEWSPTWAFTDEEFARTAGSFDNPDFVDVVVHSYRHRYGLVAGDPAYEAAERVVATTPPITVPTVVIDPTADPIAPRSRTKELAERFPRLVEHRRTATGHNPAQEDPGVFAAAVLALREAVSRP